MEGEEDQDEAEDGQQIKKNKNRARQPIFESAMNDNTFFMQLSVILLVLLAYFIAQLVVSLQFTDRIKIITNEMNLVAQAESYYAFA